MLCRYLTHGACDHCPRWTTTTHRTVQTQSMATRYQWCACRETGTLSLYGWLTPALVLPGFAVCWFLGQSVSRWPRYGVRESRGHAGGAHCHSRTLYSAFFSSFPATREVHNVTPSYSVSSPALPPLTSSPNKPAAQPHFGAALSVDAFHALSERLKAHNVKFVIEVRAMLWEQGERTGEKREEAC